MTPKCSICRQPANQCWHAGIAPSFAPMREGTLMAFIECHDANYKRALQVGNPLSVAYWLNRLHDDFDEGEASGLWSLNEIVRQGRHPWPSALTPKY